MRFFRQLLTLALLVYAASACATSASRSTASAARRSEDVERANKELLRRYYEEVWNGKRFELIDQMVAPVRTATTARSPRCASSSSTTASRTSSSSRSIRAGSSPG